ncbi:FecR family protein [Neptunitalea lumnitzerae]|uniref:Iron dicitrate transporter FecR n=1 Tax=Neptunitalea lumnitzerae TaxID=2965509 RepID=A0ABQ5MEU0_9FLAO|nr:FecR family protein [Neptunitalea sp. Y10]GLB47909.1 iron dicitrate transporter FecR [Neptunitalea sp. Y10]
MTEKEFKVVLQKYLEGKATQQEEELLKRFESHFMNTEHQKVFTTDLEKHRIKNEIFKSVENRISKGWNFWLRIAAAVILVIGAGFGVLQYSKTTLNTILVKNTGDAPKKVMLKDGTSVTLNVYSTLAYENNFNDEGRNVTLTGEAFFKVAKNPDKPFIIKTGALQTRVVGTQFNIKESRKDIKVTVTEGKVKVYHQKDTVNLVVNEQGVFDLQSAQLKEQPVKSGLYNLWQHEKVSLTGITMEDFSKVLEAVFHSNVIFKDEASKSVRVSVGFNRGEAIENIIARINLLNEVKLTQKPTNMIIIEKVN